MKFTEQQLLDTLKARLTQNGKHLAISEKTLKAMADTQYKLSVSEETELDAFVQNVLPMFESLRGNYEKDNADFVAQWKKDHPEPTPPPTPPTTPPTSDDKLDALMKEIQALKDEQTASKREKTISGKKTDLIAKMKEKGIKDDKWLNSYLQNTSISEDMDVEQKAASALEFYNLAHSTTDIDTPPTQPGTPPAGKEQFDDVASLIKRQRHITD